MSTRRGARRAARKPARTRAKKPARRGARKPAARPAGPKRRRAAAPPAAAPVERRSSDRETLRLRGINPSCTVDDLQRSLAFYTGALGFHVGERWEERGQLKGVMLKAGTCELGLSQDDWAKGRDRRKGEGVRLWCETIQDVDGIARRVTAAGGRITEGPVDQSWGVRSVSVDDPDGYHLTIYKKL